MWSRTWVNPPEARSDGGTGSPAAPAAEPTAFHCAGSDRDSLFSRNTELHPTVHISIYCSSYRVWYLLLVS